MQSSLKQCIALVLVVTACAGGSPRPAPEHPRASEHAYVHHGHGAHRFDDVDAWVKRFEDPSRDAWQRPDVVIRALGLRPDAVVADIGSASGYFPVRIARAVPEGRVWGVDIEPAMVRYLNERARREQIPNLFSILGTPGDPLLPEPVDAILMVNTYHHVTDRPSYFRRLAPSLRSGGRVVIVDFKLGELPVGPPDAMKVAPEIIADELRQAGYRATSRDDGSLPYQHLLVFEPSAP